MKVSWILIIFFCVKTTGQCDESLLNETLLALEKSLNFMKKEVHVINLDAVLGCRVADDQLRCILDSLPTKSLDIYKTLQRLQTLAAEIADEATKYVRENQPKYYSAVGGVLKKGHWDLGCSSREVNPALRIKPKKCSEIDFMFPVSDKCISDLFGTNLERNESCYIDNTCWEMMTSPGYRDYPLTHQLLYFQIAVKNNCISPKNASLVKKVNELQEYFCANILRDAEEIEECGYPDGDQDLFMEQVAVCGLSGYKDMFRCTWLQEIINWQQPSGCYITKGDGSKICNDQRTSKNKVRQKREEKLLEGNCLSHKTSVAIMSLATNLRFFLKEMYPFRLIG